MPEKKEGEREAVFGEAEVSEILERAIKLDGARDTRVTVQQLREAAMEVGVSPAAFTQALAEFGRKHQSPEEAAPADVPAPRFRSGIRSGLAVLFGGTLGTVAGILDGPYLNEETFVVAALLLAGASLRLVLSHKKEKALLPYIVDVIWLWSSFIVAVGLTTMTLSEEPILATIVGIVLASAVGGWILRVTGRDEAAESPPTLRLELTAPKEDRED